MALKHKRPWSPRFFEESAWYWSIADAAQALAADDAWPSRERMTELHERAATRAGVRPLRFAAYEKRGRGRKREPIDIATLYDGSIALRGEVHTRASDWHDVFNALAFISWPRSKAALHARQYACLAARVTPGMHALHNARTREQDTLTLFDEGGCVVAGPRARIEALRELPLDDFAHALAADAELAIAPFGHALHEHWVEGLPGPGSFARLIALDARPPDRAELLCALDAALAAELQHPGCFQTPLELRRLHLAQLSPRSPDGAQRA